jgi:hypothetical protein
VSEVQITEWWKLTHLDGRTLLVNPSRVRRFALGRYSYAGQEIDCVLMVTDGEVVPIRGTLEEIEDFVGTATGLHVFPSKAFIVSSKDKSTAAPAKALVHQEA